MSAESEANTRLTAKRERHTSLCGRKPLRTGRSGLKRQRRRCEWSGKHGTTRLHTGSHLNLGQTIPDPPSERTEALDYAAYLNRQRLELDYALKVCLRVMKRVDVGVIVVQELRAAIATAEVALRV